jgi:adenylate cyclase
MPHANLRADDGRSFGRRVAAGQLQIRDLFVIARNSSFAYRGKPCDMRRIAKELGVRDLIEGSVQRGGDAVRVNIQIRGDRRPHLGESLTAPFPSHLLLQDSMTQSIADALRSELLFPANKRRRVAKPA